MENSWIEWEFLEGEAELTLYMDGAGNSQGAGYGFVAFEGNRLCHSENGPLGRICLYEAELYAIKGSSQLAGIKPTEVKRQCCHLHGLKVRGIGTKVLKNQKY